VLGGTVLLLVTLLGIKDRTLTRKVLLTPAAVCGAWFLLPPVGVASEALAACGSCPEENSHFTRDILSSTPGYSVRTLLISIPCGEVIAFGLVLPVTLPA
jgi:hypothetical protein